MTNTVTDAVSAPNLPARVAAVCGLAAASMGVLVLAGWWLDAAALKSVIPGYVSMKPNTALALVLGGAALALLSAGPASPRWVGAGRGLALLVVLMGGATLGDYLFGWRLGIDELLFRDDPGAAATLIPGRMAPSTAACFLALGLAMIGIEWEPRQSFRPAEILALAAGIVSLISLAEYAAGQPILYGFDRYTRMALHTAGAMLVLSAGVMLARPALGMAGAIHSGRLGLRARLYGLVILASVPLLLIVLHAASDRREDAARQARADLQGLARQASDQLVQSVRAGEHLLYTLSQLPGVARGERAECARVFGDILPKAKRYTSFFVADAAGHALCHSAGLPEPVSYADRAYFQRVRDTRRYFAGDAVIGRVARTPLLSLAYPLLDAGGDFRGMVVAGLDLNWFGRKFNQASPDWNVVFTIWREDGTILYRYPEGEKWIGRRVEDAAITRAILARQEQAVVVETSGITGVDTLYAITGLENALETRLAISVGVARAELLAGSDRFFFRSLAYFGIVFALALAAAWLIAERGIRRPVAALADASRRLSAGDLSVRVAAPPSGGELAGLAAEFNRSAEALERQKAELAESAERLRRSNRALRMLSECNQALVRATSQPELLQTICQKIVDFGGYRMAWVGYAQEDATKSVLPAAHAGFEEGYLESAGLTRADSERGRGPTGTAILTGQAVVTADVAVDPYFAPWREAALARGYASSIALPLSANGRVMGALSIYSAERDAFHEEEAALLTELANDLAYGIAALRMRAEREQAEAAVRESEERFRLMVERTADYAIFALDSGGRVASWNAGAERLKGYRAAEVIGRPYSAFYTPEDLAAGRPDALLREAEAAGHAADEGWRVRKDGTRFWGECVLTALRDDAGRLQGFAKVTRDLTERKRAEEEIRALNADLERRVEERTAQLDAAGRELASKNRQLEEASRLKSEFLANMSHELRTPLNAVIGFSEVLRDGLAGELTARQREFAADIFEAGTHLLELINDILDLSKIEAGAMRLEPEAVELERMLRAALAIVREKAGAHRLRLRLEVEPGLEAVEADARKLKQILYNLLSNAVKFTPAGGDVVLSARGVGREAIQLAEGVAGRILPLPEGVGQAWVELAVEDTGVGIPAGEMGRLFEPFVQLDSSLARAQGGTGLGLAMVRRLAELHGGTVGVAARAGGGTRFSVWLPHRPAPLEAAPAAPAQAVASRAGARRAVVLVVEDDDAVAALVSGELEREGFRVIRAATGEEGLVRAAKERPRLITLDIFLPAMDGWEFLARLKANPALAATPVIIISLSEQAERGFAMGAARVLHKPFTQAELRQALSGMVGVAAGSRVLVVDDNPQAVELLAAHLQAMGLEVLKAYGGREAIESAHRERPELVVLDLVMPKLSGFEVAQALKERPQTAGIPVLVVTAKELTEAERSVLNGNVLAVMHKTQFTPGEFAAEVRRALGCNGKEG